MGNCVTKDTVEAATTLAQGLLNTAKYFPVVAVVADLILRIYECAEKARTLRGDCMEFVRTVQSIEGILIAYAKELQLKSVEQPLAALEETFREADAFLHEFATRKIFFSRNVATMLCSHRDGNRFQSLVRNLLLHVSALNLALSADTTRSLKDLGDKAEKGFGQSRQLEELIEGAGGVDAILADPEKVRQANALLSAADQLQLAAARGAQVEAKEAANQARLTRQDSKHMVGGLQQVGAEVEGLKEQVNSAVQLLHNIADDVATTLVAPQRPSAGYYGSNESFWGAPSSYQSTDRGPSPGGIPDCDGDREGLLPSASDAVGSEDPAASSYGAPPWARAGEPAPAHPFAPAPAARPPWGGSNRGPRGGRRQLGRTASDGVILLGRRGGRYSRRGDLFDSAILLHEEGGLHAIPLMYFDDDEGAGEDENAGPLAVGKSQNLSFNKWQFERQFGHIRMGDEGGSRGPRPADDGPYDEEPSFELPVPAGKQPDDPSGPWGMWSQQGRGGGKIVQSASISTGYPDWKVRTPGDSVRTLQRHSSGPSRLGSESGSWPVWPTSGAQHDKPPAGEEYGYAMVAQPSFPGSSISGMSDADGGGARATRPSDSGRASNLPVGARAGERCTSRSDAESQVSRLALTSHASEHGPPGSSSSYSPVTPLAGRRKGSGGSGRSPLAPQVGHKAVYGRSYSFNLSTSGEDGEQAGQEAEGLGSGRGCGTPGERPSAAGVGRPAAWKAKSASFSRSKSFNPSDCTGSPARDNELRAAQQAALAARSPGGPSPHLSPEDSPPLVSYLNPRVAAVTAEGGIHGRGGSRGGSREQIHGRGESRELMTPSEEAPLGHGWGHESRCNSPRSEPAMPATSAPGTPRAGRASRDPSPLRLRTTSRSPRGGPMTGTFPEEFAALGATEDVTEGIDLRTPRGTIAGPGSFQSDSLRAGGGAVALSVV